MHNSGIIETNAYIISENPDAQGVFPTASVLNHSCVSNTMVFPQDDNTFTCRAVVDIKAGSELTTNYLHYLYHFFNTRYRQGELARYWYFKCVCQLCQGDSGTECDEVDQQWWKVIINTSTQDIKDLLDLLNKLLEVFDETHYYVLEVKRRIMENLGQPLDNRYEDLSPAWLAKKVSYCRDHLAVQKCVSPGLSKYRAYISSHIAEPLYWLAKKRYQENKSSMEELQKTMREVAEHLATVIDIWGQFRESSSERITAENARIFLHVVNCNYLQQNKR